MKKRIRGCPMCGVKPVIISEGSSDEMLFRAICTLCGLHTDFNKSEEEAMEGWSKGVEKFTVKRMVKRVNFR